MEYEHNKKFQLIEMIEAYAAAKKTENSLLIKYAIDPLMLAINELFPVEERD